jgi:hypothetical protein
VEADAMGSLTEIRLHAVALPGRKPDGDNAGWFVRGRTHSPE